MKIKKNDMVMVVAGNDKGKTGKVLKVNPKLLRIIIEGVNLRKRHTKPTQKNPQGGIIEKEAPIHVSNVMILDPKTNEPTRIGASIIIDEKTGKKKIARVSVASGEMFQN
jgi:large subunit ribosomal protein L24